MKHFIIYIICFFILSIVNAQDIQPSWELSTSISGNKNYVARDNIILKPGFSYKATSGNSFNATINPYLVFPPTENIYAKPDGTIVTSPSQGNVVGTIPGSMDVSPTGGATYTIPIECAPGINGMQPNISLVYNSQSGNGIAGWGWNLSGLSMISRTPKNYYFDNEKTGLIWNSDSPLALDGERLISNTPAGSSEMEYRLQHDEYDKIIGYDKTSWGPKYFEVHKKDGTVLQYGNSSSLASYYPIQSSSTSVPSSNLYNLGWALYKIKDTNNNYVEFTYTTTSSLSSQKYSFTNTVISSITYGHEDNGSKQVVGTISFTYATNSDSPSVYIDGMPTKNSKRLTAITIKGSGGEVLNTYSLTYKKEENNYYLTEVKNKNSKNETLPPVAFTWSTKSYTEKYSVAMSIGESPKYKALKEEGYTIQYLKKYWGDVNGDGVSDPLICFRLTKGSSKKDYWAMYLNNGADRFVHHFIEEEFDWDTHKTFLFADMDNDGKDELYIGCATNTPSYLYKLSCYKSSGSSFVRSSSNDISIPISSSDYDKRKELYAVCGDFLGNGSSQFFVFKNNFVPCGFSEKNISYAFDAGIRNIFITDINGDGRQEIMCQYENQIKFYEYNNSGSFKSIYSMSGFNKQDQFYVGDFNGDGNTDLLVHENKYGREWGMWRIYLSTGRDLFLSNLADNLPFDSSSDNVVLFDVNQDGKTDILMRNYIAIGSSTPEGPYLKLFVNNGNSFDLKIEKEEKFDKLYFTCFGKFNSKLQKNVFVEKPFYGSPGSGITPHYYTFSENVLFNKITKIRKTPNIEYSITYKSAKNPFESNIVISESTNLITNLPSEFEIVKQITGPIFDQQYTFTTPLIHKQGKGLFGFKKIEVKDNIQKIITTNEYELNKTYYVTYPLSTLIKTTGGASISKTENKYEFKNQQWGFSLRPTSQTYTDYLRNVTTKTEYSSYDDSNNPQRIKITTGGSFVEIQDLKYEAKGSWCNNKISESKITRQRFGQSNYVRTVQYKYDTKGNLLTKTVDSLDSNKMVTMYSNYDKYGNPRKVTVTAGNDDSTNESRYTTFTYSSTGRFVTKKVNNFLGETTSYTYDEGKGLLLSETNRLGKTTYEYDGFGRLVKTTGPDKMEAVSVLRWASTGAPSGAKYYNYSEISGESPVITWYDAYNREIQQEYYGMNSKKIVINTEYNTEGQLHRVSEPYFSGGTKIWSATNTYDSYGRLSKVETPIGITTYSYSGLTTTVTSPNSTTVTTTNALNEPVTQKTNGKKVDYEYYASGLVKKSTPEGGYAIEMKYDLQGNRIELKDPDGGTITNTYNVWGQVATEKQIIHTDSTATTTTYGYTKGMVSSVVRNGEKTNYKYDANNRLEEIKISGKHTQGFEYDTMDRMIRCTENIKNEKTYITSILYDSFGRIMKTTYPSGYAVKKNYDKYGYLTSVSDDLGNTCWQAIETNALGQYKKTKLGNKEVAYTYDSYNLPKTIVSSGIINMTYSFNAKGNLAYREDGIYNQRETFTYDSMNRLTNWNITRNGVTQKNNSISYNSTTGNITTKSDVGYTFNYGTDKPHALTSLSGRPTSISTSPQTVTYTDFKKVKQITESTKKLAIDYGVDEQRRKSEYTNGNSKLTRYYLGNYEEEVNSAGKIRKIHYIRGGNGLAAMYIQNEGKDTLHYVYTDYQGSLVALADKNGSVKERYAFDPWGNRRNPTYWHNTDTRTSFITNRGYTLHEHLDVFRLINMNGRMYDPYMGLFMSPDPYLQAPGNWINYNRYLYCYGNPMSFTDPNGEFIWGIVLAGVINTAVKGFSGNLKGAGDFFGTFGIGALSGTVGAGMSTVVSAAMGTASTLGGSIVNGALTGAAGGFAGGLVSGMGNAWAGGANFGQGIKVGLKSSFYGAGSGAIVGGITGGIRYRKEMLIFQKGCEELGTTPNDAVPATDQFLSDAQKAWFPDAPMEHVDKFTVENVPKKVLDDLVANKAPGGTRALTTRQGTSRVYTGKSSVYFNENLAFDSAKQLYFTMGHELVHVSQYAYLAGQISYSGDKVFNSMLDFHAYNYQSSQGGTTIVQFYPEEVKQMINSYGQLLFENLSYGKFRWTHTSSFKYPF